MQSLLRAQCRSLGSTSAKHCIKQMTSHCKQRCWVCLPEEAVPRCTKRAHFLAYILIWQSVEGCLKAPVFFCSTCHLHKESFPSVSIWNAKQQRSKYVCLSTEVDIVTAVEDLFMLKSSTIYSSQIFLYIHRWDAEETQGLIWDCQLSNCLSKNQISAYTHCVP